ncbi:MAG: undecaprenyldiphospho-muramoylpentapeptide beta-N-acetylglucosaminyltransferase [Lachnospiraceae bacterium]|nr:undecaprenyldiphospho-muramoylpentapeptide beta-N-acetylglucosaminyltransferase [Lachnospiraceae bacterium]
MKKIVLTGGGTAGHCNPNLALVPVLRQQGYDIVYIGSYAGIEKKLVEEAGLEYHGISSGKLRRYFDLQNVTDVFRVIKGFGEAHSLLKKLAPDIVFSKGGFVSVPVVRAAHSLHIPVIIHESDMTPGLANRLSFGAAQKICCSFKETLSLLPERKAVFTGSPVRRELFSGDAERAKRFSGLRDNDFPTILVTGGSLGAASVNEAVRHVLPELSKKYNIVHLCGRGKVDPTLNHVEGYVQYDYIDKELPDLFAMADLVISRAGSNAIFEILSLRIPNILIPLPSKASRGDQEDNAASFKKQGYSYVIENDQLSDETLLSGIEEVMGSRSRYIEAMARAPESDAVNTICGLINDTVEKRMTT